MSEMRKLTPHAAIARLEPGESLFIRDWGTSGTAALTMVIAQVSTEVTGYEVIKGDMGGIIGITRKF